MTLVQKEVKAVYKGSTLVRPTSGTYSYDFRNNTVAQLTSDGWSNASGWSFDSNGAWVNNWNTRLTKNLPFSLSNAKKITLALTMKVNKATGIQDISMRILNSSNTALIGIYCGGNSGDNTIFLGGTGTNFTFSYSGNVTFTIVCDLEAKTATLTASNGSPSISSLTLTDTQVANIRTGTYFQIPQNGTVTRAGALSLTVE